MNLCSGEQSEATPLTYQQPGQALVPSVVEIKVFLALMQI